MGGTVHILKCLICGAPAHYESGGDECSQDYGVVNPTCDCREKEHRECFHREFQACESSVIDGEIFLNRPGFVQFDKAMVLSSLEQQGLLSLLLDYYQQSSSS